MIANDEQFAVVREQITRLERALYSLAREVRPKNPRQFEAFAQGYVDQLATLRADVDLYLGIATVKNPEPEVEVAIEDPDAALGDTRISAVTKLADRFRRALRTTVESIRDSMSAIDQQNITPEFLDRLCDPPLQAVAPGSVKVQMASPHVSVGSDLYRQGLDLLSLAIRSVAGDADATGKFQNLPAAQQKAALNAAKMLAPEKGDLVGQVGLSGRFMGDNRHVQFNFTTRKRIVKRLSRIARQRSTPTVEGVIREIDLDRRLFSLRDPDTGLTIERCKYGKVHDGAMRNLFDHRVVVTGSRRSNALRATRLRVRTIEAIDS